MKILKKWKGRVSRKIERGVKLLGVVVEKKPEQSLQLLRATGKLGVPVRVFAELEVGSLDGGEAMRACWPVDVRGRSFGMWFDSVEEWEKEEGEFRRRLGEEIERLKVEEVFEDV